MIRCFVRVVDGAIKTIIASNFKAAFPGYDIDAGPLPEGWERFDRPMPLNLVHMMLVNRMNMHG